MLPVTNNGNITIQGTFPPRGEANRGGGGGGGGVGAAGNCTSLIEVRRKTAIFQISYFRWPSSSARSRPTKMYFSVDNLATCWLDNKILYEPELVPFRRDRRIHLNSMATRSIFYDKYPSSSSSQSLNTDAIPWRFTRRDGRGVTSLKVRGEWKCRLIFCFIFRARYNP